MKKSIIKTIVFIITFIFSLFAIGQIMNKDNNNMTMEMASATLPIITMEKDGIAYNQLHGYRQPMNVSYQRQTITGLGENRDTYFTINTYGESIEGVSVELRSMDGGRLIENSPVTDYTQRGELIQGKIALKDLMEMDTEYSLTILLDMANGETVRYYTKVVWSEKTYVSEKLQFVKEFHETLYDKVASEELVKYLESNRSGDNSTFHKVNIYSSFHMITWGDLKVQEVMAPTIQLTELASQTASFVMNYLVTVEGEDTGSSVHQVEEYYKIRYTEDRIYLLAFERSLTQIPQMDETMYANDKIVLGIVGEDVPFVESEDGNIVVFEVANRLCSYNVATNKMTVIFSFYDKENTDARTLYNQHSIKILDVDEGGNVRFALYGYMNRGRHEGKVGVQVCFYDSSLNTVEEQIYIQDTKSYAVMAADIEHLLYVNREEVLYLFLENNIYEIRLNEKTYNKIVTISQDDSFQVSEDHRMLVWQEGNDIYNSSKLMVKNLNNGSEHAIMTSANESIRPLGFMGEDIIYGIARNEDIVKDFTGRMFFPMYKVCIQNPEGELLKEYNESSKGIYTVECQVVDNQILLERVQKKENGGYQDTTQDYFMNHTESSEGKNELVVVTTANMGKYTQIQVRKTIDTKSLKTLTPKEVVFEGGRELNVFSENDLNRYYVYGAFGVEGIYNSPAKAINLADSIGGVVNDERGECIWLKGNRYFKNQIMAIKENEISEGETSLAVCLDAILRFEGIVKNSQYLLDQGHTAIEILEDGLPDVQILDLAGCSLDAVLYYVNQDIPVLATLNDGEAVLITGFNEQNIVIMEPGGGAPYKKGIKDSTEWLLENGNNFITYTRK